MALSIGIDIGGTFTDVVAWDSRSGHLTYIKVASTPPRLVQGFVQGIDKVLGLVGASAADVERVAHGTTVATNTILEGKGARIGILTTQGFEDVLYIGRQKRSEMYNVFMDSETPTFLCPRRRIVGVPERLDPKGGVLIPLDEAAVAEAADYLVRRHGVEAIAVCYLFSFANPHHEQRTKEIVEARHPGVRVSLSSVIDPRFREYERLCLTAFDAYVGPIMERYLQELTGELERRGIKARPQIMQSRGGITGVDTVRGRSVATILSGPAAGVVGGIFAGGLSGFKSLITIDMGGTSCDVALVQEGRPLVSTEGKVRNYPLRLPMVDVTTIGAGGGSIAWLDAAGGLRVGPVSAGANPGPACYGLGGELPTVTDASLVLGYLDPDYFAGGALALNQELAERAIYDKIARPMGMDVVEAAAGIHRIVNSMMVDELRLVSVSRGYDPRYFSLVALGGAGPVHAGRLAPPLSLSKIVIPSSPGVLSAFGLLVASVEQEQARTFPAKASQVDYARMAHVFAELDRICGSKLKSDGMGMAPVEVRHSAEMRYVGQSYEIEVPLPNGAVGTEAVAVAIQRFHQAHNRVYGHSDAASPVEFVSLRSVHSQRPELRWVAPERRGIGGVLSGRRAFFKELGGFVDTLIYRRSDLATGQTLQGPAIIEQEDTTTVLYPGQRAQADSSGNLIVEVQPGN